MKQGLSFMKLFSPHRASRLGLQTSVFEAGGVYHQPFHYSFTLRFCCAGSERQSLSICSPTARSGASPLATGTGTLQRGHTGTWISYSQGAGVSLSAHQPLNLDIPPTNTLENKVSQDRGLETQ